MTQDDGMTKDWWADLLEERRKDGATDAEAGTFYPPYPKIAISAWLHPTNTDPQDEAENRAYIDGFMKKREELGDKFKWA